MCMLATCVTLVRTRDVKFVDIFEIWFKSGTIIIVFDEDLHAFLRAALILVLSGEIFIPQKKTRCNYAQFHSFIRVGDFLHKKTKVVFILVSSHIYRKGGMIFMKFYILHPCKLLFSYTLFLEYCTTEIMLYRGLNN